MAECSCLRPGGGWACMLVVLMTGSFLAGCVSEEAIKKRGKESDGYYQQGLSVLDTDHNEHTSPSRKRSRPIRTTTMHTTRSGTSIFSGRNTPTPSGSFAPA